MKERQQNGSEEKKYKGKFIRLIKRAIKRFIRSFKKKRSK